jgi:hypothetical protein
MDQDDDRARERIYAVFPSWILDDDLGELKSVLEEGETEIRSIVIQLLRDPDDGAGGSNPAALLFDAAAKMGEALLGAALAAIRYPWDESADAIDDAADSLCQNAVEFTLRKYQSLASEVLQCEPAVDPAAIGKMRKRYVVLREECKQEYRANRLVTCRVCHRHYRPAEYSACPSCEIRAREASRPDSQTTSGEPCIDGKRIGPGTGESSAILRPEPDEALEREREGGPSSAAVVSRARKSAEGAKRGPQRDSAKAARVAEIVAQVGAGQRKAVSAFAERAAWLRERLAERAWNRNDPLKHRGPDPKTIDKILRGETVREDVLEKLATSLSQKGKAVDLLNIPRN